MSYSDNNVKSYGDYNVMFYILGYHDGIDELPNLLGGKHSRKVGTGLIRLGTIFAGRIFIVHTSLSYFL